MSTVDTSTWSPDADLNVEIEGIPLNADAGIAQTWQALRILMAAVKGDTSAIETLLVPFTGATSQADGVQGFVPAPEAGDEDKALKGDGTWGAVAAASHAHGSITNDGKLGTASRAVVTDGDKTIGVSAVTATELGYLSGVTSAIQTQINSKAADSSVVHNSGDESIAGAKTLKNSLYLDNYSTYRMIRGTVDDSSILLCSATTVNGGGFIRLCGKGYTDNTGGFEIYASIGSGNSNKKQLKGTSAGALTWDGDSIQTTSDERLKTPLSSVPDDVLDAWSDVEWGQFQMLEAVGRKGASARRHLGLIAQKIMAAFSRHGLDALDYGIVCHEQKDGDGDGESSDVWMVRYAEALSMEAAYQRRRADRLEARVAALEVHLNG